MIAKISKWSSGRELIRYLFGPGKVHEHIDPRVLTSGIVMGVEEGTELSAAELAHLGESLDADEDLWQSRPAGGHIWHLSLSLAQQDPQLRDDQWAEIAHQAIEAVGFEGEGLQPAAWVAVGHGTSVNGHQHIHLAASLVRLDGRRVNDWQDRKTLSRVCNEIEHIYGLTIVQGRERKTMSAPAEAIAPADRGGDGEDATGPS